MKRFDLELYQKIQFGSGFPAELYALTDGRDGISYLRITSIKYHTGPASNYVDIEAVYDHPFFIIQARNRYLKPDLVSEIENSVTRGIDNQAKAISGTIESISLDGTSAVLITEFGSRVTVRIR